MGVLIKTMVCPRRQQLVAVCILALHVCLVHGFLMNERNVRTACAITTTISSFMVATIPSGRHRRRHPSWGMPRQPQQPPSHLFGMLPRDSNNKDEEDNQNNSNNTNDDENDNNEAINLEQERKRLESLLGGTTSATTSSSSADEETDASLPLDKWKKELKNPPPLTAIGRERLETEISLLESLAHSNDAIPELWSLWYHARGPEAFRELEQTEVLVAQCQPDAWRQAETILRQLIAREGIHFVEPVNRLATLLFLQARYEESKALCELVLTLKPWHFGALSGIVLVTQLLQDNEGVMKWTRLRMPALPEEGEEQQPSKPKQPVSLDGLDINTRQQWVDLMLDKARANLLRGEMGLEESFRDCDGDDGGKTEFPQKDSTNQQIQPDDADEDDAWQ